MARRIQYGTPIIHRGQYVLVYDVNPGSGMKPYSNQETADHYRYQSLPHEPRTCTDRGQLEPLRRCHEYLLKGTQQETRCQKVTQ